MIDDARRCHAKSKQSGERCKRPAAPGKRVCYMHGANAGPPKGNVNAMTHGAYIQRVLTKDEQAIHDGFIARLRADFTLNDSSDEFAVRMAAISYVQFLRAQEAGKEEAANIQARIVRESLRDLKATKIVREGEAPGISTTPAEWVTALLEEVKAARKAVSSGTEPPGRCCQAFGCGAQRPLPRCCRDMRLRQGD